MSAATDIVINDGAATPVAHTLTPIGKDDKGVLWFEQTTPAPINPLGAKRIGIRQTRVLDPKGQLTGKSKFIVTVYVPTLEVLGSAASGITPPPTVAYVEESRCEFTMPERSMPQERKDVRVLTANLLQNTQVIAAIDNLRPIY